MSRFIDTSVSTPGEAKRRYRESLRRDPSVARDHVDAIYERARARHAAEESLRARSSGPQQLVPEQTARPLWRSPDEAAAREGIGGSGRRQGASPSGAGARSSMKKALVYRKDAPLAERLGYYLRRYGNKASRLLYPYVRGLGGLSNMLDLLDLLEMLVRALQQNNVVGGQPGMVVPPGSGWFQYHDCGNGHADAYWTNTTVFYPEFNCLSGQAVSWQPIANASTATVGNNVNTMCIGRGYWVNETQQRFENNQWWHRPSHPTDSSPVGLPHPGRSARRLPNPTPEPNLVRRMPGIVSPLDHTGRVPEPANLPRFEPDRSRARDTGVSPISVTASSSGLSRGGGTTIGSPPKARDRERKTQSKSRQLGVAMFHLLDVVSETADIISAVYDALPDDVRARSGCNKKRGPGDQFGQYGLGQADCKLQAIYRNWMVLDTNQAWKNIAKNLIEDQLHGVYHRYAPPQAGGPALSDATGDAGQALDALLDSMFG